MEFFNFVLEQKIDRPCAEFHSDSDGDGFNFLKPKETPQNAPLLPQKMKFFNFGLGQKLELG